MLLVWNSSVAKVSEMPPPFLSLTDDSDYYKSNVLWLAINISITGVYIQADWWFDPAGGFEWTLSSRTERKNWVQGPKRAEVKEFPVRLSFLLSLLYWWCSWLMFPFFSQLFVPPFICSSASPRFAPFLRPPQLVFDCHSSSETLPQSHSENDSLVFCPSSCGISHPPPPPHMRRWLMHKARWARAPLTGHLHKSSDHLDECFSTSGLRPKGAVLIGSRLCSLLLL